MIHQTIYHELKASVDAKVLEEMVRATRTWLLKIPEVLSVHSGRNLDPESPWQFFYSFEVESLEKLKLVKADAYYLKFTKEYIEPNSSRSFELEFELDPSRNLKYS
jgi:divalent metal cation (Fe/Co/Zn/Cd) transporter